MPLWCEGSKKWLLMRTGVKQKFFERKYESLFRANRGVKASLPFQKMCQSWKRSTTAQPHDGRSEAQLNFRHWNALSGAQYVGSLWSFSKPNRYGILLAGGKDLI